MGRNTVEVIAKTCIVIALCAGFLAGCQNEKDFFPLDPGLSWRYRINIIPEVEAPETKKIVAINLQPVDLIRETVPGGESETLHATPRLRENGSTYYYLDDGDGIRRVAYQAVSKLPADFEAKPRYVFKYPLEKGTTWTVPSKTYLLVRRYPFNYEHRATVDFNLDYQIESVADTVQVPAGQFEDCLRVRGTGETIFLGDHGLGRIKVTVENTDWFAPGVGLVKSRRIESTTTDLFGTSKLLIELENFDG